MSSSTLMRAFLDSLLPPDSPIWQPAPDEDFDHLLDGIADNLQREHDYLRGLGNIRDPMLTPYLEELEREYGIMPNTYLTEAQRRLTLRYMKYSRKRSGTLSNMQKALDDVGLGVGGYGLQVFANDPAVNPAFFTTSAYQTFCGGPNAFCGYTQNGLPTATWSGIAHNGTVFCAVSSDGLCATSPDAAVWTTQAGMPSHAWSAIIAFGTSFCAVSTDGYCATSSDGGVTWTPQTIPAGDWRALCYTGSQLVAVGAGPTNYCATSPTGVTWTAQAGIDPEQWNAISWNGSVMCVVGESSYSAVSSNGVAWTRGVIYSAPNKAIAWNGSVFCAVGSYCLSTSTNGLSWNNYYSADFWKSIVWSSSLSLFVLIGTGTNQCATTTDGTEFTLVKRAIPAGHWTALASSGSILCAIGTGSIQEATSLNAITWTVGGTGSAGAAFCGIIGGGTYLVNGDVYEAQPGYWGCVPMPGTSSGPMCCGYIPTGASATTAVCGYFTSYTFTTRAIESPPDSWTWPCVFFLASSVVRDTEGYIVGATKAVIPSIMQQTLIEIVMRLKGLHTWALLMCDWT